MDDLISRSAPKWIENQMTIQCPLCGKDYSDEVYCCDNFGWPWNYCPACGSKLEVFDETD